MQVGHGTCNLEKVGMGIERGDAVMRRFHRQDLQRVEPLRTGVALYFLQQSLPRTRENRLVDRDDLRNPRRRHFRMRVPGPRDRAGLRPGPR